MHKTKYFPDGYIYSDDMGMLITLAPNQYVSNDIYGYQKIITWHELYRMPLKCRNMAMLCALNAIYDEYDFLNGRCK